MYLAVDFDDDDPSREFAFHNPVHAQYWANVCKEAAVFNEKGKVVYTVDKEMGNYGRKIEEISKDQEL